MGLTGFRQEANGGGDPIRQGKLSNRRKDDQLEYSTRYFFA